MARKDRLNKVETEGLKPDLYKANTTRQRMNETQKKPQLRQQLEQRQFDNAFRKRKR